MTPDEFRVIRLELDLSQRELGDHLKRSAELVKKIEAGSARITENMEQAMLELAENPPPPREPNSAPRRGRPPGGANRPRVWQETYANDGAAIPMLALLSVAVAVGILFMFAIAWLLRRDDTSSVTTTA